MAAILKNSRHCFVKSEYLHPHGTIYWVALWKDWETNCEWAAVKYFMVNQSTSLFHYLVEECL